MSRFVVFLFAFVVATTSLAVNYGKVTQQKVAAGVYLFTTTPYGDVGLSGNSIAVISADSVLVFDTTGTPATATTILTLLRKITDKPVRYVVNSHWHWDHWAGNQVYLEAFPDVQLITHEKNRQQMVEVEPRWNDEGLKVQLPGYIQMLENKVAAAKASHTPQADIREMADLLSADRSFLDQEVSLHKTYPNVTFTDSMILRPGGREIDIRYARAITPGDTYVYLPEQKILITGDIILEPYPYAIGGTYPKSWLQTLQQFESLKPSVIIPGHGHPVDSAFLHNQIALFQDLLNDVSQAKAGGVTLEDTKESIGKRAGSLAGKLGITSEPLVAEFKSYFLDIFVARAYKELGHPLSDSPTD